MILSVEGKKAFDKVQQPFLRKKKTLNAVGIEGTYLNITKAYTKEPQLISSLMGKNCELFH